MSWLDSEVDLGTHVTRRSSREAIVSQGEDDNGTAIS